MTEIEKDQESQSIRSISRGLAVLRTINRHRKASLTQIAKDVGIPYPSVCRIVGTLLNEGVIERVPNSKFYRPTVLVRSLSAGYQGEERLVSVARPHIVELCKEIVWPVSLATRVGQWMMLLDSTHHLTSLTFTNYNPGYTLPLTECATGKAFLAFSEVDDRENILQSLHAFNPKMVSEHRLKTLNEDYWRDIREEGFASQFVNSFTANPGKTSSMAVPIMVDGEVFGALAVIFFRSSMTLNKAKENYLEKLFECSSTIAKALNETSAERSLIHET